MSKAAFKSASSTDEPFHCPQCLIRQQSRELEALKLKVELLPKELFSVRSKVFSLSKLPTGVPLISDSLAYQSVGHNRRMNYQVSLDRKLNLVLFGIPESPADTSYHDRLQTDGDTVLLFFQTDHCLKTCFQLLCVIIFD